MAQYAALAALDCDIDGHVQEYRRKRDLVMDRLSGTFHLARPGGGFYFFPQAPERFPNATAFVEEAIRNNVLVIPGSVFSTRDTHFRLSYATSNDKIERGCEILYRIARG
jgi:aspartate aminotransferase/aminotransferase